jgi:hypothetical protein
VQACHDFHFAWLLFLMCHIKQQTLRQRQTAIELCTYLILCGFPSMPLLVAASCKFMQVAVPCEHICEEPDVEDN